MNIKCTFSFTNNILQPFPTQRTALHLAAWLNPAAVPILLEANADVNALDSWKVKVDFMRYEYNTFSFTILTLTRTIFNPGNRSSLCCRIQPVCCADPAGVQRRCQRGEPFQRLASVVGCKEGSPRGRNCPLCGRSKPSPG